MKIPHSLNSDLKGCSDWLEDKNKPMSRASSSSTFHLRLLSRDSVEVSFHYTLMCEDAVSKDVFIYTIHSDSPRLANLMGTCLNSYLHTIALVLQI